MNYESENEKASRKNSIRGITQLLNEGKNQIKERHLNPVNGVRGNPSKESLNTISRLGLLLNLSYLYYEYTSEHAML